MHLLSTLSAVLATLATTALASPTSSTTTNNPDSAICLSKFPNTYDAIERFCNTTDITLPSKYGHGGKTVNGIHIWIEATCSPPERLSSEDCFVQFWAMCATAVSHETSGGDGCQNFHLPDYPEVHDHDSLETLGDGDVV